MTEISQVLIGGAVGLAIGLAIIAILTFVFLWLWNTTMPEIFPGVRQLSFWNALKLLLIASILFGGHRAITTQPPGPVHDGPSIETSPAKPN